MDWTNVEIPDGVTVAFTGTAAISIRGLTTAEQGRVSGSNITFLENPVINTLRIPALEGLLALRLRDNSVLDDEALAPRRFTSTEIAAGFAEFTLSDQTSPDGAAFSNLCLLYTSPSPRDS